MYSSVLDTGPDEVHSARHKTHMMRQYIMTRMTICTVLQYYKYILVRLGTPGGCNTSKGLA